MSLNLKLFCCPDTKYTFVHSKVQNKYSVHFISSDLDHSNHFIIIYNFKHENSNMVMLIHYGLKYTTYML